jgi:spore coat protein U-like protein
MTRLLAIATLILLTSTAARSQCASITATNLVFGNYSGTELDTTSTVTVNCTSGSFNRICLGTGGSGSGTSRTMTAGGAARLNYRMAKDAARSLNWGYSTSFTTCQNNTGTGFDQSYTVYGRIPAAQNIALGSYTDNPTAFVYLGGPSLIANFTVSANISPMCTISATNLAFGSYTGTTLDAVSTLAVTCTKATAYYVNLNDGMNPDGSKLPRASGPGGALLSYTMFQNAARTSRWGNTYNLDGVAGTGNGSAQVLTVYGRVAIGQFVNPGAYSDTVIVTLTY